VGHTTIYDLKPRPTRKRDGTARARGAGENYSGRVGVGRVMRIEERAFTVANTT